MNKMIRMKGKCQNVSIIRDEKKAGFVENCYSTG